MTSFTCNDQNKEIHRNREPISGCQELGSGGWGRGGGGGHGN